MESGQSRKLAVVTGASSGIGLELAKVFAEEGFDLLIAAYRHIQNTGRPVDALALNAGIGAGGAFARDRNRPGRRAEADRRQRTQHRSSLQARGR